MKYFLFSEQDFDFHIIEMQASKPMLFNHQKQHLRLMKIKEEEEILRKEKEQQEAAKSLEVSIIDETVSTKT